MTKRALAVGIFALCAVAGCAQAPAPAPDGDAEKPELTPEQKSLVLDQAPTDIPHPLYLDFNGKAELLGYALEPETMAAPGSKLTLKLFWHSTGALGDGYLPFTELLLPTGKRIDVDTSGPLHSGPLTPANWQPGKIYVDVVEIAIPADIDAARFSIVVGFKTQPVAPEEPAAPADDAKKNEKAAEKPADGTFGAVYLSVLSGPGDGKHGGVIASLETGATPGAQRVLQAKADKRGALPMKRLPPPGKLPPKPAQ